MGRGDFEAGTFNLQASTDGSSWADHAEDTAALSLSEEAFGNLTPESSVVAPYYLQITTDSTYNASIELSNAAATGDLAGLSYTVVLQGVDAESCDDTSAGTVLTGNAPLALGDTIEPAIPFPLAPGAPRLLCFTVDANGDLEQGSSVTAAWEFTATSVDA